MEIKEIIKKSPNRVSPEKCEELVKKMRKEHEKPIKGLFEFVDAQGGWLDFSYRIFKGDPILTIRIFHGEICELPAGIVKHLRSCKRKIRKFAENLNPNARGVPSSFEVVSRVNFTPVDL